MKNLKPALKTLLMSAPLAAAAIVTVPVHADAMSDFDVSVSGSVNTHGNYNTNTERGSFSLRESNITLSAEWRKQVRAVITTKLEEALENQGFDVNEDFQLESFIREAYIEIKNIGGSPVAVIVGKHKMAFGQSTDALLNYASSLNFDISRIDEVFGVTLRLDKAFLGTVIEASIFESGRGDLKLGDINGLALRMQKDLTDQLALSVSHTRRGIDDLSDMDQDQRTALGLVYSDRGGKMKAWVQGILLKNNPTYADRDYAITLGASYKVAAKTAVVLEGSLIADKLDEAIQQVRAGVIHNVTDDLSVGADVTYNRDARTKQDEVILGLSARLAVGKKSRVNPGDFVN